MRLLLVGCEYAGKTTLAHQIVEWSKRTLGGFSHFHDHFTIPSSELSPEAKDEYRAVSPQLKEMIQRFMMQYHMSAEFYSHADHNLMGFHIEEAVYAPLYYGYGGENSGAPFRSPKGQRTEMARHMERQILERAPNTVLVLVKASPEVIRRRMSEPDEKDGGPRDSEPFGIPTRGVVQGRHIEYVLQRFEEEYGNSLISRRFVLDTTSATVDETLAEFVMQVEAHLSEADRKRREEQGGHASQTE